MTKTRVKYGANGAIYYEPIEDETPIVEEKKEVLSEIFDDGEAWNEVSKPKKKRKKKIIQEVYGDHEDL